ncbi:hypothetical protein HK097_000270 [Rhizophlyctis rosea]|uniref:E3 ubiquitin-protein ligase RNF216 RING finger HC subclass domain-containing protein n=1 Tax=Rhizophlyctis rosea TaxID=64517 RepID=A0AAD5WYY9_9FUNG|nr:hypothetical protein HK097_000270 [Rhizophlyctis rosea]
METTTLSTSGDTNILHVFPDIDLNYVHNLRYPTTGRMRDLQTISDKVLSQGWYPKAPNGDPTSVEARNGYLTMLLDRFPDADISHLRNLILLHKTNTLYEVTDRLVKSAYPKRLTTRPLQPEECFRDEAYIKGCRTRLYNDFPKHWKSTIKAVMAENNNDYKSSHETLSTMPTNNWFSSAFSFFKRKEDWCREMYTLDLLLSVDSLTASHLHSQSLADTLLSHKLNKQEYISTGQSITCGCCYTDCAFEELVQCPEGHLFCMECLGRHVEEGLFGQGQLRGRPVVCIDPGGCGREFLWGELRRALKEDVAEAYEKAVAERELESAGLDLVRCPFCSYAEVLPPNPSHIQSALLHIQNIKPPRISLYRLGAAVLLTSVFWILIDNDTVPESPSDGTLPTRLAAAFTVFAVSLIPGWMSQQ